MSKISFEKIIHYGKLSDKSKSIEFNLMTWNGLQSFDIRKWDKDGTVPLKGITLSYEETTILFNLLGKVIATTKSQIPAYTSHIGNANVVIYNDFGTISTNGKYDKHLTFLDWGTGLKYDLRPWNDDFTNCGKGITLSQNEITILYSLLPRALCKDSEGENEYHFPEDVMTDLFI